MTASERQDLINQSLETGIRAAQKGDKELARQFLLKVTDMDPSREEAWLWLSGVAETPQEALSYLQTVLALNPNNRRAQEGVRWVQQQIEQQSSTAEPSPPAPAETVLPSSDDTAYGEVAPSFILSAEQAEAIDACLERMAYESEARCIILADVNGQLVAERGQTGRMNTQVLSALAAGELAATQEMARLVGEEARFRLLLHEGQNQSVYLSDVGERLILVIVFDTDTPIGLVRMVLKQAVEELAPIIEAANREGGKTQTQATLDSDFAQLLEDELNASLR